MHSIRTLAGAIALAVATSASVAASAGVTYKVIDSGVVGEGIAIGKNAIAGNSGLDESVGFRADSTGAVTMFSAAGFGSGIYGMSPSGLVAGTRWTEDNPMYSLPVVWGLDGKPTVMPTLGSGGGSGNGMALAVNDAGDAVGWSDLVGTGVYWSHACRFRAGTVVDLTPDTNAFSAATAINKMGVIAGAFEPTINTGYHAFVYDHGTFTDLGMSGAHDSSFAQAINNLGHVAGEQSLSTPENGITSMTGFLYRDGAFVEIKALSGYPFNYAFGINDKDTVVGYSTSNFNSYRAWIWSKGTTSDLTMLLRPEDSGWTVERAMGIDGQNRIVGTGLKDGVEHAIVLQPLKTR